MIYLQSKSANINLSINPKITIVQMQKWALGTQLLERLRPKRSYAAGFTTALSTSQCIAEDWGLGSCPEEAEYLPQLSQTVIPLIKSS